MSSRNRRQRLAEQRNIQNEARAKEIGRIGLHCNGCGTSPAETRSRVPLASQTAYAVSVLRPGTLQTAGVAQRESLIAGLPVVARVAIGTDVHTAVPVDNQSSSSSLVS